MLCVSPDTLLSFFSTLFPVTSTGIHIHVYTLIFPAVFWLTLSWIVDLPVACPSGFSVSVGASSRDYVMHCRLRCNAHVHHTQTQSTHNPPSQLIGEEVSLLVYSSFSRNIKEENRESTHGTGLKYCFSVQWPDFSLTEALSFNVTKSPQTDATLSGPHHPIQFPRHPPVTHMLTLKH